MKTSSVGRRGGCNRGNLLRVKTRVEVAPRGPGVRCEAPGCHRHTNDGKPYCIDHLDHLPYPAMLMEREREREREGVAARGGRVRSDGLLAQELLWYLQHIDPCQSARRIGQRLGAPHEALVQIAHKYPDVIRVGKNQRGNAVLTLVA